VLFVFSCPVFVFVFVLSLSFNAHIKYKFLDVTTKFIASKKTRAIAYSGFFYFTFSVLAYFAIQKFLDASLPNLLPFIIVCLSASLNLKLPLPADSPSPASSVIENV